MHSDDADRNRSERSDAVRIAALLARGELSGLSAELERCGIPESERQGLIAQLTEVGARARGQAEIGARELALAVGLVLAVRSGDGVT